MITNIHHPEFNFFSLDYDVALLKVMREIQFSDSVQPIKIVGRDAEEIPVGTMLRVSGFGETLKEEVGDPTVLRAVSVPKITNEQCDEKYAHYIFPVNDNMLCAGFTEGGRDACSGDSGGALVNSDGVAVGVVSWGIGCAEPAYPGVYARLSFVADFIDNVLTNF